LLDKYSCSRSRGSTGYADPQRLKQLVAGDPCSRHNQNRKYMALGQTFQVRKAVNR
jgi:hypothetical protein